MIPAFLVVFSTSTERVMLLVVSIGRYTVLKRYSQKNKRVDISSTFDYVRRPLTLVLIGEVFYLTMKDIERRMFDFKIVITTTCTAFTEK